MTVTTLKPTMLRHGAAMIGAVLLLTLSAKISVPFIPVPMTLQVAAVLALAGVFGLRLAAQGYGAYLAAGAVGLPVFAGTPAKGLGLAYMAGPTGGYLLGFLAAILLIGVARDRFGTKGAVAAMPVGLAVIYALGIAWLARFVPAGKLLELGVLPFLFGDLCKLALAALITLGAAALRDGGRDV